MVKEELLFNHKEHKGLRKEHKDFGNEFESFKSGIFTILMRILVLIV